MREIQPLLLLAPEIPPIKRCELYNKYRPLVPLPFRDEICPKPPQEVLDSQKKLKNAKVRAKALAKKKNKPAKIEKETTADESREDGKEESENVEQQVAAAAAAGPQATTLVVAAAATAAPQASLVPPVMPPWTIPPHPFHPNPYLYYGGFLPFNSYNNNL
jgi:hypothetical protein